MADTAIGLSLRLAQEKCKDFYPYELVLEEGIAQLYRAELTVLTPELHSRKELLEILDKAATLVISQKMNGEDRTRYLHGIVTGIKSNGVFANGKDKDCYSHVLTIEAELARLRFNRVSAPHYRVGPLKAVQQILEKNNLNADYAKYMEGARYSGNLLFEQQETSDLEFAEALLSLYGLSYVYRHPKPPQNGLGQTELYFSTGKRYPPPAAAVSGAQGIPDILKFDFLSSREAGTAGKMNAWTMRDGIGTDGVVMSAPYPNANHGSPNWHAGASGEGKRFFNFIRLFHGYERSTPADEIDRDVMLILEARLQSLELAKSAWAGEADTLLLQPGALIELARFYGKRDTVIIKALSSVTRLHVRVSWPQDLAVSPEGAGTEMMRVAFDAIDFGDESGRRFCPNPAHKEGKL
jgi:hypothetical protein